MTPSPLPWRALIDGHLDEHLDVGNSLWLWCFFSPPKKALKHWDEHLDVHPDVHLDVQFIMVIVLGLFLKRITKITFWSGILWNLGDFGEIREISGKLRGTQQNSMRFCTALSMNSVGIPGGSRGNAGFSGNFGFWSGFGCFGGSKGFCANGQHWAWRLG